MKILSENDLINEGISVADLGGSTLNYQGKTFKRKEFIPKKFIDKAREKCQEILKNGRNSFITENNFSFLIWEEEIAVNSHSFTREKSDFTSREIIETDDTRINQEENHQNSPKVNNTRNYNVGEYNINQYSVSEKKYNSFSEQLKAESQKTLTSFAMFNNPEEETVKYRGLSVNQHHNSRENEVQTTAQNKKKRVKTYRGVAYES